MWLSCFGVLFICHAQSLFPSRTLTTGCVYYNLWRCTRIQLGAVWTKHHTSFVAQWERGWKHKAAPQDFPHQWNYKWGHKSRLFIVSHTIRRFHQLLLKTKCMCVWKMSSMRVLYAKVDTFLFYFFSRGRFIYILILNRCYDTRARCLFFFIIIDPNNMILLKIKKK